MHDRLLATLIHIISDIHAFYNCTLLKRSCILGIPTAA